MKVVLNFLLTIFKIAIDKEVFQVPPIKIFGFFFKDNTNNKIKLIGYKMKDMIFLVFQNAGLKIFI